MGFVRDDGIGEDGVRVAATTTDHAEDPDLDADDLSIHEVDQVPLVVGEHMAVSPLATGRARLRLYAKTRHSFGVNDISGIFYKNHLAILLVFSYHCLVSKMWRHQVLHGDERKNGFSRAWFFLFFMRHSVLYTIVGGKARQTEKNVPSYTARYHR